MQFSGKRVLVTGASRGVGAAVARAFADAGATVAANARSRDAIDAIADAHGHSYTAIIGSVDSRDGCRDIVEQTAAALGGLDVLVANAGVFEDTPFEAVDQEAFDRTMAVNLGGVFFCAQAAMPHLLESGGNIVAVASDAGLISYAGAPAYSASKGGVVSLVRSLAIGHAARGVRVNCVCPGNIDTDMIRRAAAASGDETGYMKAAEARAPMGRMARPEEIAAAILYLASDAAGFTTGVALPLDGGGVAGFD